MRAAVLPCASNGLQFRSQWQHLRIRWLLPLLLCQVTDEGIELYNNECGFEEKHVNSICDANDSSKKEIKSQGNGYTGEKGRSCT